MDKEQQELMLAWFRARAIRARDIVEVQENPEQLVVSLPEIEGIIDLAARNELQQYLQKMAQEYPELREFRDSCPK